MAYIERSDEEIIAAFERWLERHPSPDEPVLGVRDKVYSIREFVELVKSGEDPFFNLEKLRAVAREHDFDPAAAIDEFPAGSAGGEENQCDQCDQCDKRDQCQEQ